MRLIIFNKITALALFIGWSLVSFSAAMAAESQENRASATSQHNLFNEDINAPTVEHTPPLTRDKDGGLLFSAEVRDDVGVRTVLLFYRAPNAQQFESQTMQRLLSNSDRYATKLDKTLLPDEGVEYYIKAEDTSGNTLLHGYSFSPIILSFDAESINIASDPVSTAAFDKNLAIDGGKTPIWKNKWLWIGIGAVAVAVAASSSSSDNGNSGAKPGGPVVPVTVTTPPLQ